jgi:hypothetical protein
MESGEALQWLDFATAIRGVSGGVSEVQSREGSIIDDVFTELLLGTTGVNPTSVDSQMQVIRIRMIDLKRNVVGASLDRVPPIDGRACEAVVSTASQWKM